MPERDIYWNPILETLPIKKLRALQFKKFKRIVEWAYNNSPFYRKLYKDAGLEPGDIKTFNDIKKVPKTDKGMLRDVQSRPPFPYGDILAVPLSEVTEFRQTSGTTGIPVYQADADKKTGIGLKGRREAMGDRAKKKHESGRKRRGKEASAATVAATSKMVIKSIIKSS